MAARLAYPRTAAGRLGLAIRARMASGLLVALGPFPVRERRGLPVLADGG
jgi:hypothetical protein